MIDASVVRVHQHGACIAYNNHQDMGRSRGGLTSKIHAVVDTNGLPIHLALTPGETHDNRLCSVLLSALLPQTMLLADRGYDADWIRELARQQGAWANIPPKRNRKDPICFSPYLYRARNLIERFFNKIKQCRRVATRYDKLAANYLAFVKLASIRIWLRGVRKTVAELAADEEFAEFRDAPGIFLRAAVSNTSDPRAFLRGVQKHVAALAADEDFAEFRDAPGIFLQAAMSNPSDPRAFLRAVQKTVAELAAEKDFAEFRPTPGVFTRAAVSYSSEPRAFLRRVQQTVAELAADEEFAEFRDTHGILREAAVNYPSDPRAFLRRERKGGLHASRIGGRRAATSSTPERGE
jgi:transposase